MDVMKMPLANMKPFLEDAKANRYALGCFNVFNTETLEGVMEAAVRKRAPIVIAIYEHHLKYGDLETFSNYIKDISDKTDIPVILHLDHANHLSSIMRAIKCNFTSFMFDCPADMPLKEKIIQTKKVAEIVHSLGLTLESELGHISRVGVPVKENITDPDIVEEFVEKTGVDILTPSIGAVHGMSDQKAHLNLELLKEIRAKTNCHLSLHGTSGLSDETLKEAIRFGINKIVLYTRISNFAIQKIKAVIDDDSLDLPDLTNEIRQSFRELVEKRLEVYGCKNICKPDYSVCGFCSSVTSKYCVPPEYMKDNACIDKQRKEITDEAQIQDIVDRVIKEFKMRSF
jgi:fructose-bisphosphate aldolase, class II